MTRICKQGNIYNKQKTLTQFYLKTGPHADTHTKRKETPESLFDPRSHEERQAQGSEFVGTWSSKEKEYSVMRHLPTGRRFGPSHTCGTRGLWRRSCGEQSGSKQPRTPRNSHRETGPTAFSLRKQTRPDPATVNKLTARNHTRTLLHRTLLPVTATVKNEPDCSQPP